MLIITHLASLLLLYREPLALQVLRGFTAGSLRDTIRQLQQRLAKQADSSKADQTALGQMLDLLLQLGEFLKTAGYRTGQISFAHMLNMWAEQSGLKPKPKGLADSQKRQGSRQMDTEMANTLLLVLLHHKLQRRQYSWQLAKKVHCADELMEVVLAEARQVLGTLQKGDRQLKLELGQLIQEGLLCCKLCGADLQSLRRDATSSSVPDRPPSTLRMNIRKICQAKARPQQQGFLTSVAEED